MTVTVNGHEADPGCYVDGHWGQYAGGHLWHKAMEFATVGSPMFEALGPIWNEWPKEADGSLVGAYGSERDATEGKGTGPWAALNNFGDTDGQTAMELADAVLELLNENTEGGYWEWHDGEAFLRSYLCPECQRYALDPFFIYREPGQPERKVSIDPCDYCCDADDPGVFA